ncbi:MAG: aminodeoxychorismate lyase [Halomonadaceae bacterium]|nr:MAG: aminodeoxychorismate lyase [Halomonadaceae bacterium]
MAGKKLQGIGLPGSGCEWFWPGEDCRVPLDDRGLAYADGLFETLRVNHQGPVLMAEHRARLLHSAHQLEIPFGPTDFDEWQQQASQRGLLKCRAGNDQILKITLTRGSGGRGYGRPEKPRPRVLTARLQAPPIPQGSVKAQLCRYPVQVAPHRAGLKTLEKLDQVMASRELRGDVFEGLMPDSAGHIVEGTRSNLLLLLSDRHLVTPPSRSLAVQGTLRDWLIRELPTRGLRVRESALTLSMLKRAQGVAVVNSVFGVVPLAELDGVTLGQHPLLEDIRDWCAQQIGLAAGTT